MAPSSWATKLCIRIGTHVMWFAFLTTEFQHFVAIHSIYYFNVAINSTESSDNFSSQPTQCLYVCPEFPVDVDWMKRLGDIGLLSRHIIIPLWLDQHSTLFHYLEDNCHWPGCLSVCRMKDQPLTNSRQFLVALFHQKILINGPLKFN